MRISFRWKTDPKLLARDYENTVRGLEASIDAEAAALVDEIEVWMKDNAIWTDRTGDARRSLFALVRRTMKSTIVEIGHGVPYGFWLETIRDEYYAIIGPALDHFAPRLFNRISHLQARGRGGRFFTAPRSPSQFRD